MGIESFVLQVSDIQVPDWDLLPGEEVETGDVGVQGVLMFLGT